MKIIVEGKKDVRRLLGKQRIKKDALYRKNNYLLFSECDDGLLVHNVITGHLVLLNQEEQKIFNALPMYSDELTPELIEEYFLVPIDFAEKDIVDNLRIILTKINRDKGINGYTILTTTNCNARCFYCYQADYPHFNMTSDTAHRLVDYMVEHKGNENLVITWFGGEPLVGIAIIDQISNELNSRGIQFVSSMISNGYLFNEEVVKRAVSKWKMNTVQISLDGTQDIYNKTKAFVGGDVNPYNRVMNNIALLADNGVRVGVRLNLGQHNSEDLRKIIYQLKELLKLHGNIGAYVHTLFEGEGYIPTRTDSDTREKLYKKLTELNYEIIDLGLNTNHLNLPSLRTHSCMADDVKTVVVYPDGKLYQCEHTAIGDEFGTIFEGVLNENNYNKFLISAIKKECGKCPLYPSCIILKECEGLADRNYFTCNYDIATRTMSLLENYKKAVERSSS